MCKDGEGWVGDFTRFDAQMSMTVNSALACARSWWKCQANGMQCCTDNKIVQLCLLHPVSSASFLKKRKKGWMAVLLRVLSGDRGEE